MSEVEVDADVRKSPAPHAKSRRIEIFRRGGEDLGQHIMPFEGVDESVMAGFAKLAAAGAGADSGATIRCLFREPREGGLSLVYAWFKSGYVLPRHSHNADCVYYVISGELHMGTAVLRKGDGMFIPADSAYTYEVGPDGVEVLEFRNAPHFHILFKGNDDAHWERMAKAYRENASSWTRETEPPSDRAIAAE